MIELGQQELSIADIEKIVIHDETVSIAALALENTREVYRKIEELALGSKVVYGINTGFGALAECLVPAEKRGILQRNVLISHAVGVGRPLEFFIAKTMLLLRLNTLVKGYSGASPTLINHLLQLLNHNFAPVVPCKGSVGASGDLAPLAHLGLLLLGEGEALTRGEQLVPAKHALKECGLAPISLGVRDGIALINGTQAMSASAVCSILEAEYLCQVADLCAASTIEAIGGHLEPFSQPIHDLKQQRGQPETAANIRWVLRDRNTHQAIKNIRTQDPYSLRCVPQVHGASKNVLWHAQETVLRELNSVTDNPIFISEGSVLTALSGGNFHGQYLALALDYLAMGVAELASISERRLENLLNPHYSNGLPAFLIENGGLNSGYMMLHVTASALVNENRVFCHPASTDSIPTSANREDHVSMGMTSANKLRHVIENTKTVLAIELLCAHQGINLRPGLSPGFGVQVAHASLRQRVPFRREDALFQSDILAANRWLDDAMTKALIRQIFAINSI
jgi:histidine ammonia-lyase